MSQNIVKWLSTWFLLKTEKQNMGQECRSLGSFIIKVSWFYFFLRLCKLSSHCSVAQSCPTLCDHGLQHAMLPCPSLSSGVCSNSCLVSWWCHPTIPSSVVPFSSCIQSFPASGSFLMSRLFTSGVISWIAEFHKYGSKFSFALAELLIPSEVNALKKNQIKNSS